MRKLVVAVSLLIIYGSLYPFNFDLESFDPGMLPALFDFRPGRTGRGDLLANIVLFLPFGFFAMQAAQHRTRWTTWLAILVAGFTLAHSVQIVQIVVPGRVPSSGDTLLNMVGCALGCALGTLRMPRLAAATDISAGPLPVSTILALFLVVWNLRPFIPSIDLQLLINNIKHLINFPIPHPLWTYQGVVTWLIIFHFLDSDEPRLVPEKHYPTLVFITLALGFFVVGNIINIDRIAGALIALPLWQVVRRLQRPPLLSFLTFVLVVGISFQPFELRGAANHFNWVPFSGALNGNLLINVLATTKKLLLYGSLIWLLVQSGVRLSVATISVSALLFISEHLQVYIVGRTPEITDSLLALMAGAGFHFWEDFRLKSRERPEPTAPESRDIGAAHHVADSEDVAVPAATSDDHEVSGEIDHHPLAGNQELVINLRRSQANFLSHLAQATSLDIGGVCERLVALAARPDTDWSQDVLFSEPVKSALAALNPIPADNHWTQVEIQLDRNSLDLLDSLSESMSSSRSRTLRHLIADCMEKDDVRPQRRRHRRPSSRRRWQPSLKSPAFIGAAVAIALVLVMLVLALHDTNPTQNSPDWAGNRASLILDSHTHTRYSDGKLTPDELVAMAVNEGCDALAITDHSDTSGTVSDSQLDEMEKLRERYPELLLFNGVELNMPSYGHREHVTLMASPSVQGSTLRQFRDLAEHRPVGTDTDSLDSRADIPLLQRIAEHQARFGDLLLLYNHPARKDPDIWENFEDLSNWNDFGRIFSGVEGAPGHQNAKVIGSYEAPLFTKDRWDPVVAEVGGVWDQLLSHGQDFWGALASSDYHNDRLDKPPCAFSRTHLAVPERSYRGVLAALKNGTFWADHGRILDQLWFSVHVEGLEGSAAYPGSTVYLTGREEQALLALSIERGPGSLGQPLLAEFIGSCRLGAAETLAQLRIPPAENTVTATMPLLQVGRDQESCTVRVRVRLERDGDTDYLAYTNHIRLILD